MTRDLLYGINILCSYLEMLFLLYRSDTFALLHNQVLADFCSLALPHHLSSITSVHLHFRFRQTQEDFIAGTYRYQFPPPWDEYTFENNTKLLIRYLPNLTNLSFFLQGPLIGPLYLDGCSGIFRHVEETAQNLRFLAVRLLQPAPDFGFSNGAPKEAGQARGHGDCLIFVEPVVRVARDGDGVDRSEVLEGQLEHEVADADMGRNPGRKIGTMYVLDRNAEDGISRRHYAVEIEGEKQEVESY